MLESLSISRYERLAFELRRDNSLSADNQQERPGYDTAYRCLESPETIRQAISSAIQKDQSDRPDPTNPTEMRLKR